MSNELSVKRKDKRDNSLEVDAELTRLINFFESKLEGVDKINIPQLIEALKELASMIEMYDVKNLIIQQLKLLIVHQNFDGHMLHTVISGEPGCGKTTVAKILAKIWNALNVIQKPDCSKSTNNLYFDIILKSWEQKLAHSSRTACIPSEHSSHLYS